MTPDEYLKALRKNLKGFSHFDQTVLIEEIGSHIESGEEDPRLGKDPAQRRQKLMSELGSPGQMAKGFKRVYQPGGLIDFLLIAIPYLLNLPINLLLVSLMPKYPWADARLVIVFHLILLAIGFWRRSILLTLYWLADLAIQLLGILWYVKGYYGSLQTVLWYIVLGGLIFQLGHMVWQNRRDILIVTFALLPIFIRALALALWIAQHGRSDVLWGPLDLFLFQIFSKFGSFIYYTELVTLAPFFIIRDRDVRWSALAIFGLLIGLSREWLDPYVVYASLVYYLWIILPVTAVFMGWWLDRSKREKLRLLA